MEHRGSKHGAGSRFAVLGLWAMLGANFACAARDGADAVPLPSLEELRFEGVTRFSEDELAGYLFLEETGPWPWSSDQDFDEALVPVDTARIEALYQAHGYYEAAVTNVRVIPNRDGDEVTLVVTVREGPATTLESFEVVWLESSLPVARREQIEAACSLAVGRRFEVPALESCAASMLLALRTRGYARAQVKPAAAVDRARRQAAVTLTVSAGPLIRVADLRFAGLGTVPEHLVRNELDFALGELLTPRLSERLERAAYAMDVFRTVDVNANGPLSPSGELVLLVTVDEATPQSLKVGVGLGIEPTRWDQRVTALYTHRDLFGQLTRFDLRLRVGYAELPMLFGMEEHGPVALLEPRLTKKGWVEKRLTWSYAPSIELDIGEGYQYYSPRGRVSVSRFFFGLAQAELAHSLRFVDFFDVSPTLDANRSLLGLDFRDPYTLSDIELDTHLYLTDRVLDPRNGAVLGLRYTWAGGVLGGNFDFHKLEASLRGYWQMAERFQLAARVESAWILPYGDDPGAPINLKLMLGGADTVRGFGLHRLSPKTELCPKDEQCRSLPIGGNTSVLMGLELRSRVWRRLFFVVFGDAGDVQEGEVTYRLRQLAVTTGGGLRLDTLVGKFRTDLGCRVNDPPLARGEDRCAFYLALGEAF